MCTALDLQEKYRPLQNVQLKPFLRWPFWTTCNFYHSFLTHCKYEKHEHYCTKSTFYTLLCLFTWETFSAHDTNCSIQNKMMDTRKEIIQICQICIIFISLKNWIEQLEVWWLDYDTIFITKYMWFWTRQIEQY